MKISKAVEKKLFRVAEILMELELSYVLAVQLAEEKNYFISIKASENEREIMKKALDHAATSEETDRNGQLDN
jgi:hypothetical protein